MLKALLKKQLLELNQSFFTNRKTGKRRSHKGVFGMLVFFGVMMLFLAGVFFALGWMMKPLFAVNLEWLYFVIMGAIALMLGVFGSVFNTFASLYQAKDNNLLLSLPVPVRYILVARLAGVYLMGLMYSGIVALPALIVYIIAAAPSIGGVLCALIGTWLLSVLVLCLSCGLGWVVAWINGRLKNKSLLTVLTSLLFMGAYFYVCSQSSEVISRFVANALVYGEKIRGSAYPLYLFGQACAGDGMALLTVSAVILGVFALICVLMARSFLKLAAASGASSAKRHKAGKSVKVKSISSALFDREWRHYLSSATYMLNCSMGTLFMIVAAVAIFLKGSQLSSFLTEGFGVMIPEELISLVACAILCMLLTMNDLTAPSISLEGKTLWLAQSLPVQPFQLLTAKLKLSCLMTWPPALLCAIALICVLPMKPLMALWLLVLPLLMSLLLSCFGLIVNLKAPNLNWTSETAVVKQSMGVMLVMLGGWAYVALLGVGYYVLRQTFSAQSYLALCALLTTGLSVLSLCWLRRRGAAILSSL